MTGYSTLEEIVAAKNAIEAGIDGYEPPVAFALGIATVGPSGSILDVSYPHIHLGDANLPGAVLANVVGYVKGTHTYELAPEQVGRALADLEPAGAFTGAPHPHLAAWTAIEALSKTPSLGGERRVVAAFLGSLDDAPRDAIDGYLRLHLLSMRKVQPHGVSLDGIFGLLTNVVWTNHGPFEVDDFELTRMRLRAAGHEVTVKHVDKFPRMLDYVVPSGVRIADGSRVRFGAHLAEGTVVMHEGFCNFNAGTLGAVMVEGRISAGVVVGDGSDVGGGASIMGTLSGGGQEVISVGRNTLIGANGGLGISLGDDCIVEAGLYLTAGTLVRLPDGTTGKARDLSGATGILFRRNSATGAVEAIERSPGPAWKGPNQAPPAND